MSARSMLVQGLSLATSVVVIYCFVATTHIPTINHDILTAGLFAFSLLLGLLLIDLMDGIQQGIRRRSLRPGY